MKILYSYAFIDDVAGISQYVEHELNNPKAATSLKSGFFDEIQRLKKSSQVSYIACRKSEVFIDEHYVGIVESRLIGREVRYIMLAVIQGCKKHHNGTHDKARANHCVNGIFCFKLTADKQDDQRYGDRSESCPEHDTFHDVDTG